MKRQRRGIMLVEIMLAVMLVAAAMVMASRLTVETFLQHREVPAREAAILRSQGRLAELRRVVWSASAMTPTDHGVRITRGGQTTDFTGRFRIDGPVLIAETDDGEVRLVSQVLLANGGRP